MTDTSKLERYKVVSNPDGLGYSDGIKKSEDGFLVPYEDYQKIAAERDALQAALIAAEAMANGSEGNIDSGGIVYAQIPVDLIAAFRAATGDT